jgi:diguanylate cyclase (GGDEF)-like protein
VTAVPNRLEELRALVPEVQAALAGLSGEVGRLQAELAQAQARLAEAERLADRDPLTGLLNRRGFGRELRRAAAFSARHGVPAAVVYLDMNGFKAVNDTLGHDAGDAALAHVARLLEGNIRETDAAGRLGGDEFAVVLLHAPEAAARAKASSCSGWWRRRRSLFDGRAHRLAVAVGCGRCSRGPTRSARSAKRTGPMYADKTARGRLRRWAERGLLGRVFERGLGRRGLEGADADDLVPGKTRITSCTKGSASRPARVSARARLSRWRTVSAPPADSGTSIQGWPVHSFSRAARRWLRLVGAPGAGSKWITPGRTLTGMTKRSTSSFRPTSRFSAISFSTSSKLAKLRAVSAAATTGAGAGGAGSDSAGEPTVAAPGARGAGAGEAGIGDPSCRRRSASSGRGGRRRSRGGSGPFQAAGGGAGARRTSSWALSSICHSRDSTPAEPRRRARPTAPPGPWAG